MKKLFSIVATLSLVFGLIVPVHAAELTPTVYSESWGDLVNAMKPTEYGGAYIDGDVMHIQPVTDSDKVVMTLEAMENSRSYDSLDNIVVDEPVLYTYQQLEDAGDRVFAEKEDLGIGTVSLIQKDNAILVGATSWDDEKKQAVRDVAEIDHVLFETLQERRETEESPVSTQNSDELETADNSVLDGDESSAENYALQQFYVGDQLTHTNPDTKKDHHITLGACVVHDRGYITTAHNLPEGRDVFLNGRLLGTVTDRHYGGIADVAFIKQPSNPIYGLTNMVRLVNSLSPKVGTLNYTGDPAIEGAVVSFGSNSGRHYGKVIAVKYETTSQENPNAPYVNFSRLIRFELDEGTTIDGDSGGPVMVDLANSGLPDEYKLIGIHKGVDRYGTPVATRWDSVVSVLDGVQLY